MSQKTSSKAAYQPYWMYAANKASATTTTAKQSQQNQPLQSVTTPAAFEDDWSNINLNNAVTAAQNDLPKSSSSGNQLNGKQSRQKQSFHTKAATAVPTQNGNAAERSTSSTSNTTIVARSTHKPPEAPILDENTFANDDPFVDWSTGDQPPSPTQSDHHRQRPPDVVAEQTGGENDEPSAPWPHDDARAARVDLLVGQVCINFILNFLTHFCRTIIELRIFYRRTQ
jgi:hypothetical protein